MNYYVSVLKNYAVFSGRARRKEYWMFVLFNFIFSFGIGFFGGLFNLGALPGNVYSLAILLPSIAVVVRRMHDTNRSGWYCLIPFYGFILLFFKGDVGPNRFGPDPKAAPAPAAPAV